jgi:Ca2+-binding RTX toxin-like protein
MRSLLVPGIAVLLGATISGLGAADRSASGVADDSEVRVVDSSASGVTELSEPWLADFPAREAADVTASEPASEPASATADADLPTCFGKPATLVGTGGDDVIVGSAQVDVIVARAGSDVVRSRGGADLVCGGRGDDWLFGGSSPLQCNASCPRGDRISGDEGDDRIVDRVGYDDLLVGGSGDDYLMSNPPRGKGPDCCLGRGADKTLVGGPGADQLISLRSYNDNLRGGAGPDRLSSMSGGGESRQLAGGPGPDVLNVAGSGDIVVSLTGDGDQLRTRGEIYLVLLTGGRGPVEVDLAAGGVRLIGAAAGDVITHLTSVLPFVVVYGTHGDDRLIGGDSDAMFFGRAGRDTCINAERVAGCST